EFDGRSLVAMNRDEAVYGPIGESVLSAQADPFRDLPWAHVEPGAALPLATGVNPAWAAAIASFRDRVVVPLLGDRSELSREDFSRLKELLAAELEFLARRPKSAWDGTTSEDLS